MNRFFPFLISLLLPALLFGCKNKQNVEFSSDELIISTEVVGQYKVGGAVVNTATRTDVNADMGFYVTQHKGATPTPLVSNGNIYDNNYAKFEGGSLKIPTMYYPSRKDAINLYGYLPYDAAMDPLNVAMAVSQIQDATTLNSEDFLAGVASKAANSADKIALSLSHVKALVRVKVKIPKGFDYKEITECNLLGTKIEGTYNIETKVMGVSGDAKPVKMHQVSATGGEGEDKVVEFEALALPQTGEAKFCALTIEYNDGRTQKLETTVTTAPVYQSGKITKFALEVDPSGVVNVTASNIDDWTDEALLEQAPVNNVLRVVIFDKDYRNGLEKVVLTIDNKAYTCSGANFFPTVGFSSEIASSYDILIPADGGVAPISYPYHISKMVFGKASDNFTVNASIPVVSSGVVSIAVMNESAIVVQKSTLDQWLVAGIDASIPTANRIRFHMMDCVDLSAATSVEMTVGTVKYTSSVEKGRLIIDPNGNNVDNPFIKVYDVLLPDDSGKIPATFPYLVSRVVFKKGATAIANATFNTSIAIFGNNLESSVTEVAIYKGNSVNVTGSGFAAWEAVTVGGTLDDHNVYNLLTINLWDYEEVKMNANDKIVLKIDGVDYTCTKTNLENCGGDVFTHKYKVKLPADGNKVPKKYSYKITDVTLYAGATENIKVTGLSIEISQNNIASGVDMSFALMNKK